MENGILTPTQLWKDYNPSKEELRTSYLSFKEEHNYYEFEAYINGDSYEDENIRIYVQGCYPKTATFNSNIIFIGPYTFSKFNQSHYELAKLGYGIFNFNYQGKNKTSTKYTRYPKCINYANIQNAGEHLTKANPSADTTCLFVWTKVCRRVINLVKQIRGKDCSIFLHAFKEGADIGWQVAATDNRVDGLCTILNAGWKEYRHIPKLSNELDFNFDDERKRWFSACATQSYIKFVKCPTLCLCASNSPITSLDRIEDTARMLSSNDSKFTLAISVGLSDNISVTTNALFLKWIQSLSQGSVIPLIPSLKLTKSPKGELIATAEIDKTFDVEKIIVNYSYDEIDSTVRSWSSQLISMAGLKTDLTVYDETSIVFAYVSVLYKNGIEISSIPTYIQISPEDNFIRTPIKRSRIIYNKNFGVQGWLVENLKEYNSHISPKIEEGALSISGITSEKGDLSTYTIGEYKYKSENQNLLQFDAFSTIDRNLTVQVCSTQQSLSTIFYAKVNLKANTWTKCSLKLQDFKTEDLIPLKEWKNIKKLSFIDIDNAILNNIIWV